MSILVIMVFSGLFFGIFGDILVILVFLLYFGHFDISGIF